MADLGVTVEFGFRRRRSSGGAQRFFLELLGRRRWGLRSRRGSPLRAAAGIQAGSEDLGYHVGAQACEQQRQDADEGESNQFDDANPLKRLGLSGQGQCKDSVLPCGEPPHRPRLRHADVTEIEVLVMRIWASRLRPKNADEFGIAIVHSSERFAPGIRSAAIFLSLRRAPSSAKRDAELV